MPARQYITSDGKKLCSDCRALQPVSNFYEIKICQDGRPQYSALCKEHHNVKAGLRQKSNKIWTPEKAVDAAWERYEV